ncbi:hypothetical protein [Lacisediminihabitans changchengi]|uniref:Uncharacterized protein n=1 Tax=Lacisediminihabitans changchengi TaxID=2787634 RepID=A0A934W3Z3_9MICO|nr:hypothetical protein [Lacisediminihabitans changchengi]MBK4348406.1 hypothetical protein [Lacisediminihabitans changchengi]
MTRAVAVYPAQMSIVLPGTWANIPLDDERATEHAISELLKKQVGRDDRLARLRRDARERLRAVAKDAREADAVQLALSLEILPGIPFPASMVIDYRPWLDAAAVGDLTLAQRLALQLPSGDVLDLESGVAVRTFVDTTMRQGTDDIPVIKLEYYLVVPSGERLLHVVADVPIECDPEIIATLFDAIVDSIRWFVERNAVVDGE